MLKILITIIPIVFLFQCGSYKINKYNYPYNVGVGFVDKLYYDGNNTIFYMMPLGGELFEYNITHKKPKPILNTDYYLLNYDVSPGASKKLILFKSSKSRHELFPKKLMGGEFMARMTFNDWDYSILDVQNQNEVKYLYESKNVQNANKIICFGFCWHPSSSYILAAKGKFGYINWLNDYFISNTFDFVKINTNNDFGSETKIMTLDGKYLPKYISFIDTSKFIFSTYVSDSNRGFDIYKGDIKSKQELVLLTSIKDSVSSMCVPNYNGARQLFITTKTETDSAKLYVINIESGAIENTYILPFKYYSDYGHPGYKYAYSVETYHISFSPDGRSIAYFDEGKFCIFDNPYYLEKNKSQ
ncbi:hypothetical protein HZA73_12050 [candidate division TA06 bacterium]|nr:hypothetical protein [candidate division TA06 bacterium]